MSDRDPELERRLTDAATQSMAAITNALLESGLAADDARHEEAEQHVFDCVIKIAELFEAEFDVTIPFRHELSEAIHDTQFVITAQHLD